MSNFVFIWYVWCLNTYKSIKTIASIQLLNFTIVQKVKRFHIFHKSYWNDWSTFCKKWLEHLIKTITKFKKMNYYTHFWKIWFKRTNNTYQSNSTIIYNNIMVRMVIFTFKFLSMINSLYTNTSNITVIHTWCKFNLWHL